MPQALVFSTRGQAEAAAFRAWSRYRQGRRQNARGEVLGERNGEPVEDGTTVRWSEVYQRADTGQWWIIAPEDGGGGYGGALMEVQTPWFGV